MTITPEQQRELLNKYHLTTLHPTEWPHSADDDDFDEDEDADADILDNHREGAASHNATQASRLETLGRHASQRSHASARQTRTDAGVQKDEPDALGRAPSVVGELRRRGLPVEEDLALRNKFMLSSTSFNPALYLSHVHHNATTDDLLRGLDFLSRSIEEKSASLKVLVESNFERFVRAKATIDTVYTEMRTHGVEADSPVASQPSGSTNLKSHTRQPTRNQTHFRNSSGAFGSQFKIANHDKKKNALTKESEYGVQGIRIPLQEVSIKAEEVWGPALGGRERDETLKLVLGALDQHREVFSLSGTMYDSIHKNDYAGVVTAYKQAKQHADRIKRLAATARQNGNALTDAEVHQTIITARMWHDVCVQTDGVKRVIWKRLRACHARSSLAAGAASSAIAAPDSTGEEEHLELIGILMQLGVDENPIWEWINSGYLFLREKVARSFERARIEIEIQRRRLAARPEISNNVVARHLRSASPLNGAFRSETDAARESDTPEILAFWTKVHSTLTLLLSTSHGLLAEILKWWENAQSFITNKAQKSLPPAVFAAGVEHLQLDPDHVENIRSGASELIALVRESISAFFTEPPVEDLSALYSPILQTPATAGTPSFPRTFSFDPANIPPPSPQRGDVLEKFAFWPPQSNSLSGTHYLSRLMALVGTAAGEMANMRINSSRSNAHSDSLKLLIGSVRERCIAAACAAWNNDAERCRALESWQRCPDRRDLTLMPIYFEAWEDKILANLQKMAYVSEATGAGDVVVPPPAKLLQAIRGCFVTSLYKGLSGMVENAERGERSLAHDVDPDGVTVASGALVEEGSMATEAVDATSRNVRMLLTLSNFNHLRTDTIPRLIVQFEAAFSVKLTEESKTVRDVLSQIDAKLFQSFVKPTVESLTEIIVRGITSPSWVPTTSHPANASPYVYDTLLALVLVHSEVTGTTGSTLTNQVLSYLLEQCSLALITAVKQRPRYDLAALMQATLDVEFLAQTLNNYATDRAGEIQSQIYLALDERTDNDARAKLPAELPEMRSILKRLRESTKGEFGCFRREKRGHAAGTLSGSR